MTKSSLTAYDVFHIPSRREMTVFLSAADFYSDVDESGRTPVTAWIDDLALGMAPVDVMLDDLEFTGG